MSSSYSSSKTNDGKFRLKEGQVWFLMISYKDPKPVLNPKRRYSFQSMTMLGSIRTILVWFSLPSLLFQELEDESQVISVALVDDKFEVLSGGKYY